MIDLSVTQDNEVVAHEQLVDFLPPRLQTWFAWAAESDPDLASWMQPLVNSGNTWDAFVAAGMSVRLRNVEASEARATLRSIVQGEGAPAWMTEPPRWAAGLTDAQTRTISDLAVAQVHRISSELERLCELEKGPHAHEAGLLQGFTDLVHLRDDVECVAWLLRTCAKAQHIDSATNALDRLVQEKAQNLIDFAMDAGFRSPRLERLLIKEHDSWEVALKE